ncbi:universal stress protein [Actinoplanes teichomyceticus]|uniref:Nucleotide-binding universal stress UspA family protein n=1 Tax=Actinoplanes teichomyceticus TaxID=1867 RepID=A0A561VI89_ACTTI|nr:universal stress protein [Actinoplanes teichomyceticus]TWG11335.1 nucleotide-binding universal stress UspA family protein [Actinoplanes teichomyceticus]GIF16367.1 hypothetical protein Ate01nite_63990 [Actinoplanes teichomyceticus]
MMHTPAIVVGTDGTGSGTAAVRWAAREADRRGLPLLVLHVLEWDWAVSRYDFSGEAFTAARDHARTVIMEAARVAGEAAPDVAIELRVPVGRPAPQLLDASAGAAQLVVGDRGRGGFTGLLLGSVSRRMAAHAHCPVVVVRGRADPGRGPVAAGVDDSDSADDVLGAAFAAADARDADLVVVRSYVPAMAAHLGNIPPTGMATPDQDVVERDRLARQLEPWQGKYPHVPVQTLVSHESAAAMLAEVSHGTQLIVVGSHGHGVLTGTLLGSTGTQLLHHADCPVLIVRG